MAQEVKKRQGAAITAKHTVNQSIQRVQRSKNADMHLGDELATLKDQESAVRVAAEILKHLLMAKPTAASFVECFEKGLECSIVMGDSLWVLP